MSVGFFFGIARPFELYGEKMVRAVGETLDAELRRRGLVGYVDPIEPTISTASGIGRSRLDHDSASCIADLVELAQAQRPSPNLEALCSDIIFCPVDFDQPFLIEVVEPRRLTKWTRTKLTLSVASAFGLRNEILAVALALGLPAEPLSDETAQKITKLDTFGKHDDLSELRVTWLLIHEAVRLAIDGRVALVVVG